MVQLLLCSIVMFGIAAGFRSSTGVISGSRLLRRQPGLFLKGPQSGPFCREAEVGSLAFERMACESLTRTQIRRMRVAELRKQLESRNLKTEGTKPVLVERLIDAEEHGADESGSNTEAEKPLRVDRKEFDGGSRGNPGPAGAGAVLFRLGGDGQQRQEVWSGSVWVGGCCTNNEAEYTGLIKGLEAAKRLGIKNLSVEGDSKLVVQQVLGKFKVKSTKMQPLHQKAKELLPAFDSVQLMHISRVLNARADVLANIAMDTRQSSDSSQDHSTMETYC